MDLISNCTLVFDIDAIVLHTEPDTMEKKCFTHCHLCLTLFNVEIHLFICILYFTVSMICVSPVKLGFVSGLVPAVACLPFTIKHV